MMLQALLHSHSSRLVLFFALAMIFQLYFNISVVVASDANGPVNDVKISQTPGIPIDSPDKKPDEDQGGWLSRNKWWVTLGVIVFGGAVAVGVSGAGDGGDGGDSETGNGAYELNW